MSKKVFACLLASAALWHCSDPENDGGNAAGTGGSSGSAGKGGSSGSAGSAGTAGAGGTGGDAGTGGTGGTGGTAGSAGSAGASGMGGGGAAGTGGSPQACDKAKGEFTVASAPGSCFTLLGSTSTNVELPSKRNSWNYDEGLTDCQAIGSQLASLATLQEYNEAIVEIDKIDVSQAAVTPNVWIGARTNANAAELTRPQYAASFQWASGEPFTFTNVPQNYGDNTSPPPWQPTEPTDTANELCINMRADFGPRYLMNNWFCANKLAFALCERKLPLERCSLGVRTARATRRDSPASGLALRARQPCSPPEARHERRGRTNVRRLPRAKGKPGGLVTSWALVSRPYTPRASGGRRPGPRRAPLRLVSNVGGLPRPGRLREAAGATVVAGQRS